MPVRGIFRWVFGSALAAGLVAQACAPAAFAQDLPDDIYTTNDFGGVGLLQTRTARFAPDGEISVGATFLNPQRRFFITWQILPWLEATFRYTDPTTLRFPSGQLVDQGQGKFFKDILKFKQGQSALDRGADLKFRLWKEGPIRPALALGLQDGLGTGAFSGEYIVATKRIFDFDVTLGMGWGFFATRNTFTNPFKILGGRFKTRGGSGQVGGTALIGNFFTGKNAALFGGVEYFTPIEGLSLKLEYSSADPQNLPLSKPLNEDFPLNFGLSYQVADWFHIGVGVERGDALVISGTFRSNLHTAGLPKFDPPPPPIKPRRGGRRNSALGDAGTVAFQALPDSLREYGLVRYELTAGGDRALVRVRADFAPKAFSQAAGEALFKVLPAAVSTIEIRAGEIRAGGGSAIRLSRQDIEDWQLVDSVSTAGAGDNFMPRDLALVGARAVARIDRISDPATGDVIDDERKAAVLKLLPAGAGEILITDGHGYESHFTRPALMDRSIRHLVQGVLRQEGIDYRSSRIEGNEAEVVIEAPYWLDAADYRDIANHILEVSRPLLESLTIIGKRHGLVVARHTAWPERTGRDLPPVAASLAVAARALPVGAAAGAGQDSIDPDLTPRAMFIDLARHGFYAPAIHVTDLRATLYVSGLRFRKEARNLGWIARIAANHLPAEVEQITVISIIGGVQISKVSLMRRDLENAVREQGSPAEILAHTTFEAPDAGLKYPEGSFRPPTPFPGFVWSLRPFLRQHVGDPEKGLYLADVAALFTGRLDIAQGLSVRAAYTKFLFGNLDKIEAEGFGPLPRVRSLVKDFLQQGRSALIRLQADYLYSPKRNWYTRVSAGLFEWMYGGVGGEVLYRPYGEPWAVAVDLNWVKQRDFNQKFRFRNYQTVTGHVSLYYELPVYNLDIQLDVGRYLARDKGATFTISRSFASGVRVGAWATKTNVSATDFGEGSFDKGFYISVPLEVFWLQSNRTGATFAFRPLTKDGGQKLLIGPRLIDVVKEGNLSQIKRDWSSIVD